MKFSHFLFQCSLFFLLVYTKETLAGTGLELTQKKQMAFDGIPLVLAPSADGKAVYVLVRGKIIVYSPAENRILSFIIVDSDLDNMTVTKDNYIVLSGSKSSLVDTYKVNKSVNIDLSKHSIKGYKEAPILIAVYSDYQCPYCVGLESLLQQVLEKYPREVKLVFKNYPLDFHHMARKAAAAALAAHDQGKFWQFHTKLFENSSSLNDDKIQAIARELKLNMSRFNKKMQDPGIQQVISSDMVEARENGVNGTPAIYINGKQLKDPSFIEIEKLIKAELAN